ncbi:MAG: hypothetical protein R3A47_05820 [Polyangiales bacterium]
MKTILYSVLFASLYVALAYGCGTAFSVSPAPNMSGNWDVAYQDTMQVEVTIGGATEKFENVASTGGTVTLGNGTDIPIDCARADIFCPSEILPPNVSIRQNDPSFPHRVWLQVPTSTCSGQMVAATMTNDPNDPHSCGPATTNPDCDSICDGEIQQKTEERFGLIDDWGNNFGLLLGAASTSDGSNCALLGISTLEGKLTNSGSAATQNWTTNQITDGKISVGYAGACVVSTLGIGASIKMTIPYTAARSK